MRVSQPRPGVYDATMTAHELSALLAGARMALSFMEQDPTGATDEARAALNSVLADFDAALARLRQAAAD
jgi:predicted DNA-binding transcriptional regulator YafY